MIYYACLKEAYNFLIYATPPKTTTIQTTFSNYTIQPPWFVSSRTILILVFHTFSLLTENT